MGERRRRRRVRVVVGGDEDGLERRDRALLGRGDPLLEAGHLGGKVGLVAHRRRHPAQQRGDLRASLGEAEDVVDEEEDVAALLVAEVFGHGQAGQGDPLAGAGRLVHLTEREGRLGEDAGLGHLGDEVVALAAALADAGEHGVARMLLGDVADQLLDDDRLADARTTEDADLAALLERADQVDDLEARLEDLHLGRLLVELGGAAVDGTRLRARHGALVVDGPAEDVEDATQRALTDGDRDRRAGVEHRDAARESVRGGHRDRADPVVAQVLLHFADQRVLAFPKDLDGVVDGRQSAGGEFDVDDGSGDLDDPAGRGGSGGRHGVDSLLRPVRLRRRQRAFAPDAISIISRVMFDWRTLL